MFLRFVLRLRPGLKSSLSKMSPGVSSLVGKSSFFSTLPEKSESDQDDPKRKRVTLLLEKVDGTVIQAESKGEDDKETIYDILKHSKIMEDYPMFGSCGGTVSCSTCHVIFDEKDFGKLRNRTTDEELDLIINAPHYCETSRLSCCIKVTKEIDGMSLKIPALFEDQRTQ